MDELNPAQSMRTALRTAFPVVTFSVRTRVSCAEVWVHVAWIDGPTERQVQQATEGLWQQTNYSRRYTDAFLATTKASMPEELRTDLFVWRKATMTAA